MTHKHHNHHKVKARCQQVDTSNEDSLPYLFRLKGSVVPNVLLQTLFVTAFAAAITAIYFKTNIKPGIPQTFIPVLGFVVGLLLTYRTNTAYDRYWEGRRAWSSMVIAIRNLTRYIWVGVKRKKSKEELEEEEKNNKRKFIKDDYELKRKYEELKKYEADELKKEKDKMKDDDLKKEKDKMQTEDEEIVNKKIELEKKKKELEELMTKKEEEKIEIEKKSAVRLLIGFAFAVKHYLREEEASECDD
ncbi:24395_t:CDS:2, partial [Dentiscutata erythropus]